MANQATLPTSKKDLWSGGTEPFKASYGKLMMWFFLVTDALTFSGFLAAYGFSRFKYELSWPVPDEVFTHFPFFKGEYPLFFVALMTFILIMSSVTMVLAVNYGHKMKKKQVILWLSLTIIGGITFLGSQGWEWYHFIHGTHYGSILTPEGWAVVDYNTANELILRMGRGLTVTGAEAKALFDGATATMQGANLIENEYAPLVPQYANFFFFITGFHGFHVFSGVVFNFIILVNVIRGVYDKRGHYEMVEKVGLCLLYTSPSPRDVEESRMPSSA